MGKSAYTPLFIMNYNNKIIVFTLTKKKSFELDFRDKRVFLQG